MVICNSVELRYICTFRCIFEGEDDPERLVFHERTKRSNIEFSDAVSDEVHCPVSADCPSDEGFGEMELPVEIAVAICERQRKEHSTGTGMHGPNKVRGKPPAISSDRL